MWLVPILICISLITSNSDNLHMLIGHLGFFLKMPIYILLSIFK